MNNEQSAEALRWGVMIPSKAKEVANGAGLNRNLCRHLEWTIDSLAALWLSQEIIGHADGYQVKIRWRPRDGLLVIRNGVGVRPAYCGLDRLFRETQLPELLDLLRYPDGSWPQEEVERCEGVVQVPNLIRRCLSNYNHIGSSPDYSGSQIVYSSYIAFGWAILSMTGYRHGTDDYQWRATSLIPRILDGAPQKTRLSAWEELLTTIDLDLEKSRKKLSDHLGGKRKAKEWIRSFNQWVTVTLPAHPDYERDLLYMTGRNRWRLRDETDHNMDW